MQQIQDEDIVASFAPVSSSADLFSSLYSGVYSSAGVLQSLPGALTNYWAQALQANPALANIFAAEFFTQGVVGTLDVYA